MGRGSRMLLRQSICYGRRQAVFECLSAKAAAATEWLWKGPTKTDSQGRPLRNSSLSLGSTETIPTAEINATVAFPDSEVPLRHRLSFTAADQRFRLSERAIENDKGESPDGKLVRFFSRLRGGEEPVLTLTTEEDDSTENSDSGKIRELQPTSSPRINPSFRNIEILPGFLKSRIWGTAIRE